MYNYAIELLKKLEKKSNINQDTVYKEKAKLAKKYPINKVPSNIQVISILKKSDREKYSDVIDYLSTKPNRMLSGVSVVAVMTEPRNCPNLCMYCPGGEKSEFGDVPKSYTGNEPASMRAERCDYESYIQVMSRLQQYVLMNSSFSKVDLIIMGGTFPSYPLNYQTNFIKYCYKAMNDFGKIFGSSLKDLDFKFFKYFFEIDEEFSRKGISDEKTNLIKSRLYLLKYLDLDSISNKDLKKLCDQFISNTNILELLKNISSVNNLNQIKKIKSKIISLVNQFIIENDLKIFSETLSFFKKQNETSNVRCIGLNIETRPDYGDKKYGFLIQSYGATKVEIGVQTLDNDVLKYINRGHDLKTTINSIKDLKDLGFKINLHYMPGLPKKDSARESLKNDLKNLKKLVNHPDFMADMLKIYPTQVIKGTKLYDSYVKGDYKPLSVDETINLIFEFMKEVPLWVRIMRVQRDIPTTIIEDGPKKSNLRQMVNQKIEKEKIKIKEIRHREIGRVLRRKMRKSSSKQKEKLKSYLNDNSNYELKIEKYNSSSGKEYFLHIENKKLDAIAGFLRLRIPSRSLRKEITNKSSLIRELHVYGETTNIGETGNVQHRGFGKKLMKKAEDISKELGLNKILVISGVGVKEYYRKLGYNDDGVYLSKKLD